MYRTLTLSVLGLLTVLTFSPAVAEEPSHATVAVASTSVPRRTELDSGTVSAHLKKWAKSQATVIVPESDPAHPNYLNHLEGYTGRRDTIAALEELHRFTGDDSYKSQAEDAKTKAALNCPSGDCHAYIVQESEYCDSLDCVAILKKDPKICTTWECGAYVLKDSSLCNDGDCRALVREDAQFCSTLDCVAYVKKNPELCSTADCVGYLKNDVNICRTSACVAQVYGNVPLQLEFYTLFEAKKKKR